MNTQNILDLIPIPVLILKEGKVIQINNEFKKKFKVKQGFNQDSNLFLKQYFYRVIDEERFDIIERKQDGYCFLFLQKKENTNQRLTKLMLKLYKNIINTLKKIIQKQAVVTKQSIKTIESQAHIYRLMGQINAQQQVLVATLLNGNAKNLLRMIEATNKEIQAASVFVDHGTNLNCSRDINIDGNITENKKE